MLNQQMSDTFVWNVMVRQRSRLSTDKGVGTNPAQIVKDFSQTGGGYCPS